METTNCSMPVSLRRGKIGGSLNSRTGQLQNGRPEIYFYGRSNFLCNSKRVFLFFFFFKCHSNLNASTLSNYAMGNEWLAISCSSEFPSLILILALTPSVRWSHLPCSSLMILICNNFFFSLIASHLFGFIKF